MEKSDVQHSQVPVSRACIGQEERGMWVQAVDLVGAEYTVWMNDVVQTF